MRNVPLNSNRNTPQNPSLSQNLFRNDPFLKQLLSYQKYNRMAIFVSISVLRILLVVCATQPCQEVWRVGCIARHQCLGILGFLPLVPDRYRGLGMKRSLNPALTFIPLCKFTLFSYNLVSPIAYPNLFGMNIQTVAWISSFNPLSSWLHIFSVIKSVSQFLKLLNLYFHTSLQSQAHQITHGVIIQEFTKSFPPPRLLWHIFLK